jgi:hypothetical protein
MTRLSILAMAPSPDLLRLAMISFSCPPFPCSVIQLLIHGLHTRTKFSTHYRTCNNLRPELSDDRQSHKGNMTGPWNPSTKRVLLLCIIDPKAIPKWDRVAARMGPQFSGEACRYVLHMKAFPIFAKSKSWTSILPRYL